VIDEDAAHGLGGGPQVVGSRRERALGAELEERLVDQCGGVEGVAGRLLGHPCGRELPQLVVDEREQVRGGLAVTSRGGIEQASHLGHASRVYRPLPTGSSEKTGPGERFGTPAVGR